ncbi:MAG: anti-sigma factor RsbA family regulatory protein [bacterium]
MTSTGAATRPGFRHEALLYAGDEDFLVGTVPFIRAGLAEGELVYVMVAARRIGLIRSALGADADWVRFADVAHVGRNPARLCGAWREFLDEHATAGRPVRGIGEPVNVAGTPAGLVEFQRHEALLNIVFASAAPWRLLCPYDTEALEPDVITEAMRTHPYLLERGEHRTSAEFRAERMAGSYLADPLHEPVGRYAQLSFGPGDLRTVHATVAEFAERVGMDPRRADDLVVAANEVAINSVRHAAGMGTLRVWREDTVVVCEIRDSGHIAAPLAGRLAPGTDGDLRRGLWLANRLCDLVQIRVYLTGSVVRLHLALIGPTEMRLRHITLHDQLTGAANRAMLRDRLTHALVLGERDGRRHALLFCDLDGFKSVNDTYGHAVGDEVLVGVAGRLRAGVRPGDTLARVGGDEFVVLCEGVSTEAAAGILVERITDALATPLPTAAGPVPVSLSVGVAMSASGQSAEDLIAKADAAMYRAKATHRVTP